MWPKEFVHKEDANGDDIICKQVCQFRYLLLKGVVAFQSEEQKQNDESALHSNEYGFGIIKCVVIRCLFYLTFTYWFH